MATFFECFFNNNPDAQAELAALVAPDVLDLISTGQIIEEPAGLIDNVNTVFTLANVPNPISSLALTLLSGSSFTPLVVDVDYTTAIIATVFTINIVVPPAIGEGLQAVYYLL